MARTAPRVDRTTRGPPVRPLPLPLPRAVGAVLIVAVGLSLVPSPTISATGTEAPLVRIERIADEVDFDWRGHGVTFHIGCTEVLDDCPPAAHETATRRTLIAERSLDDREHLAYFILHELSHAWQSAERAGGPCKRTWSDGDAPASTDSRRGPTASLPTGVLRGPTTGPAHPRRSITFV